jgi:hypothetical protein
VIEEFTGGERGMAFLRQEARVVERFRIIEVAESESVTEAARRFGCSRTTVYKLVSRYRQGGLRALMNQPRGPREPIPLEEANTGARDGELIAIPVVGGLHHRYDRRAA